MPSVQRWPVWRTILARRAHSTGVTITGCVGSYRIVYVIDGDLITIERVDHRAGE